jgi:hypothetical protein
MTKGKVLSERDLGLLWEVVWRRNPRLAGAFRQLGNRTLSMEDREQLRLTVASELTERGLEDDWEPSPYGLELERLIDLLGHY